MNTFSTPDLPNEAEPRPENSGSGAVLPSLDLVQLWEWARPRLWIPIACVLLAIIGAFIYVSFFAVPLYASSAHLYLEPSRMIGGQNQQGSYGSIDVLKSIEQRAVSASVILRVVEQLELEEEDGFYSKDWVTADIIRSMRRRVSAQLNRGSRVVVIRATHWRPEVARDLASAFATAAIEQMEEENTSAAAQMQMKLRNEIDDQKSKIFESEEKLHTFSTEVAGLPWSEGTNIVQKQLEKMTDNLNEANREVKDAEILLSQWNKVRGSDPMQILQMDEVSSREPIPDILKQLADRRAKYSALERSEGPRSPELKAAQSEVITYEKELMSSILVIGESFQKGYDRALDKQARVKTEMDMLKANNINLEEKLREHRELSLELESQQIALKGLLNDQNNLNAISGIYDSQTRIIEEPFVDNKPYSPKKAITMIFATFAGGLGGMSILGFLYFLKRKVESVRDVEGALLSNVVASLPRKPTVEDLSSTYRRLQAKLSLCGRHRIRGFHSVVFSSYEGGAGRTTFALGYAQEMAAQGSNVLLIDGDIRNYAAARHLAIGAPPGGAFSPTRVPNLHLIYGNAIFGQGGSPLHTLSEILPWAGKHFDCVVVDSPPLSDGNEGLYFSAVCDATCLIARSGTTEATHLKKSKNEVVEAGANQVFGLLNFAPSSKRRLFASQNLLLPNKKSPNFGSSHSRIGQIENVP